MTSLRAYDTRSAVIDGVLERSLLTVGDGLLVETIDRLELFLRRYPDDIYLSGALRFYLPQLLEDANLVLAPQRRQRFEDHRRRLEADRVLSKPVAVVLHYPHAAKDAFTALARTPGMRVGFAIAPLPHLNEEAIVALSPLTLLPIAEFLRGQLTAGHQIQIATEDTAPTDLSIEALIAQLTKYFAAAQRPPTPASTPKRSTAPKSIAIRQLGATFAAQVSGVDATSPVPEDQVAAIEAAIAKYGVLVFRDQRLTDQQQMVFTRNFGTLETAHGGNITRPDDVRLTTGLVAEVSNVTKDYVPLPRDSRQRLFSLGNLLWHSDGGFRSIPPKYSLLSARIVNPRGGDTEFADMRAAYDALDDYTKREIDGYVCEYSLMYSRGSLGFLDYTDEEKAMFTPVRHRLVRTHPVTGRRSLFLSSHAGSILGMPTPEARILLRDLTEHATQPRFVYVHKWQLYDLVMWDNCQIIHRGRRYDETQPRDLRRTTVAGDRPTAIQTLH